MTHHLTAEMVAEALEGPACAHAPVPDLTFDHRGEGRVLVTLWRWDDDAAHDVEVEARTFRLVEVES